MVSEVETHLDQIKAICQDHLVDKLYLIGSAVTGKVHSQSDIDFLVKFQSTIEPSAYFNNFRELKSALEQLLDSEVDLIEMQTLKNPVLIRSINRNKVLIYG